MIGYQSINDAWKIKDDNIPKTIINKTNENTCENFTHVLSCEKCIKKLKEKFDSIEPKKQIPFTEHFTNNNIVTFINNNFIIIILVLIIIFLLNNRQKTHYYPVYRI